MQDTRSTVYSVFPFHCRNFSFFCWPDDSNLLLHMTMWTWCGCRTTALLAPWLLQGSLSFHFRFHPHNTDVRLLPRLAFHLNGHYCYVRSHNLWIACDSCYCLAAKSCPTLWDPMDCSPPDSSVHGISQARILDWVAISYSRGSSQPRDWTHVSCIGRWILYHWATAWGPIIFEM